jgi:hypothetical protein
LAETLAARNDQQVMKPIRELIDSIIVFPREPREPIRFDIRARRTALLNNEVGMLVPRGQITPIHRLKSTLGLGIPSPSFVISGAA